MRTKFLSKIARLVTTRPWTVIAVGTALTIASIVVSAAFLQMNTDQDDLVSEKIPYHNRYKEYLREFGDLEYLYVVVETNNNLPRAKEFVRNLAKKLGSVGGIKEITYQVSNPKLEKSFLLYLPADQLKAIGEFLPKMDRITGSGDVFKIMNELAQGNAAASNRQLMETGFRFLDGLLDGLISTARDGTPYKPFLQQAFFGGERAYDEDGFLLSENGNLLFVMIMPEKNYKTLAVIEEPLKKIRATLNEAKKDFPGISTGLTGRPVLAADEMSISDSDMTLATIAALFIVTLIFIAYFKNPVRPAMAAAALAFGIAQTFGVTTIVIGHLNILSIVFAVVLVGAGIEFGLQIVSRYREELAAHKNTWLAIETAITQTGKGNLTACLTTAAAFFAACFTNFLALQELGFIAGMGILLCLANMFTVLPAMMFVHDRNKLPDELHTTLRIGLGGFAHFYRQPGVVIAVAAVVTAAGLIGLFKIGFNHNLLDLQAKGLESVNFELKILEESTQSTWYVPLAAASEAESKTLAEKLKTLPTIGRVETIAEAVPENQGEKIGIISNFPPLRPKTRIEADGDPTALASELKKFGQTLSNLTEMAFSSGEANAVKELEAISQKAEILSQLAAGHESRIANYELGFMADLRHHINLLKSGLKPEPVSISDMPESIRRRYISDKTGRLAVYAYPKEDIWDPAKMAAFIKDVRSVDPNVTGTPVEVYESSRLLEQSFKRSALLAMLAIILIVAADFRSLKLAGLALLPLALGLLWLFELMGILGIRFNLANFFGIPILIGIGVDNAVQIVHRYKAGRESVSSFMTKATGIAVLLTSATTLASFGTLVFARHQGIASLGAIMSIGTITCFVGSMVILPCALAMSSPRMNTLPKSSLPSWEGARGRGHN